MTREEAIEILKTDGCYECAVEKDSPYNCSNGGCEIREAYYMAIESLESDVRPVVRGEWIQDKLCSTSGGTYGVRRCSVCEHYFQDLVNEYNYCPNCGAEMGGDSK